MQHVIHCIELARVLVLTSGNLDCSEQFQTLPCCLHWNQKEAAARILFVVSLRPYCLPPKLHAPESGQGPVPPLGLC
eukprot:scaffold122849_cov21-Tisochrysis_lutea.AAC.1